MAEETVTYSLIVFLNVRFACSHMLIRSDYIGDRPAVDLTRGTSVFKLPGTLCRYGRLSRPFLYRFAITTAYVFRRWSSYRRPSVIFLRLKKKCLEILVAYAEGGGNSKNRARLIHISLASSDNFTK